MAHVTIKFTRFLNHSYSSYAHRLFRVSYAILEPGKIPKIHGVTRYDQHAWKKYLYWGFYRFPGQEHVVGNSKIPSVIYYDKHGNLMAAAAEAESTTVIAQAEDEGWIKAEL